MRHLSFTVICACMALGLPAFAAAPMTTQQAQIDAALKALRFPSGSGVTNISFVAGNVAIDFSPETAAGIDDCALEALTDAAQIAFHGTEGITKWRFTCNGRLLSSYLPPVPEVVPESGPRSVQRGPQYTPAVGALTGKTIAISPGHGWTSNSTGTGWATQRGYWQGIIEDFLNPEFMQYLNNFLVNNGATVYPCRELDKTYGQCTTVWTFAGLTRTAPNKPWWQMASLYHNVRQGAPSSVYDNGRTTDANRDIATRPLYAIWRGADIMVSLHNNGDSGTASGTLTMYETSNGYMVTDAANQYGSQYLGQKVHARVISELRANYLSNWYSYGAQGFAGNYGENNFFKGPACIVETAFMDTPTPDNAALHDENYKMLVAKAIYEGICDYFHVTPTYNTAVAAPSGTWSPVPLPRTWSVKLGSPVNSAPSSSGGWVYAATDAGVVYGIPATAQSGFTPGVVKWRYPPSGGLGAAVKARPSVYDDTVYAVTIAGKMVAMDRLTGALKWTVTVPNSGNLQCPPAPTADGMLLIGSDNGRLYSYSQSTGELLRTFPTVFGAITSQVAAPDYGHVWLTSADGKVRCVTGDLLTVLWQKDSGSPIPSAPFVLTTNNSVYVTTAAGSVVALNASNGGTANGWPAAGVAMPFNIGTSPWADGNSGIVSFGMDNHSIAAVSASSGAALSDFPLKPYGVKEFTSSPIALNGVIYIGGTDGRLYALKRGSGAADPGGTWRTFDAGSMALPGMFTAAPCLTGTGAGDVVVAGNTNGWLYAFPI
ncbi:MAG TPA: PQQ-binding-like beta-propeller repeat protein [Armatimonadota bacterium]|jgi:N-acetylmuramoyl-L-alanine amidase